MSDNQSELREQVESYMDDHYDGNELIVFNIKDGSPTDWLMALIEARETAARLDVAKNIGVQEGDEAFVPIYWKDTDPIPLSQYIAELTHPSSKEEVTNE